MAAAKTKPQKCAADECDSRESAKVACVKGGRNRMYDNHEYFVCCGSKVTSSGTVPKANRVRRGKGSLTRAIARPQAAAAVHKWYHRDAPCVGHPSS